MAVTAAEEHLHKASQDIDVGTMVSRRTGFLFGSSEAVAACAVLEGGILRAVAEAEVNELQAAISGDKDIRRLEVVMVDTVTVEVVDGIENLIEHTAALRH